MRTRKGFTIVELVVVIAVIAILAAVLIPTFSGVVEKTDRNTALKLAEAAYKEARAEANKDGSIIAGEEATVDGFKFRFAAEAASAEVILYPDTFEYILSITNDKITTTGKRDDFQPDQNAPVVAATGVTMYRPGITLEVGQTEVLHVSIAPANATNKNVTWTSSNTDVATVANGLVTAVSEGTTLVTATTEDSGYTDTCTVTVERVKVNFVSLNALNMSFTLGDVGRQLTATVKPANAADQTVTWKSQNENIATVNNGFVEPVAPGYTEIEATTANNISAKCGITVNGLEVKESVTVVEGSVFTVPYVAYPAGTVAWSVVDGTIAQFNTYTGRFTALKEGITKVIAEINGFKKECTITVTSDGIDEPSVTGITLDQTSAYVVKGGSVVIIARAPAGSTITWTSSAEDVATVSNGVINGIKAGKATITASIDEGDPVTCVVTVIETNESNASVTIGGDERVHITDGLTKDLILQITNQPADCNIEWTSSNESVVKINNGAIDSGTIEAINPGAAIITAALKVDGNVVAFDTCTVIVEHIQVRVELNSRHAEFSGIPTAVKHSDYVGNLVAYKGYKVEKIAVGIGETSFDVEYDEQNKKFIIPADKITGGDITVIVVTASVEDEIVEITDVTLDKEELTLSARQTAQLEVTVLPSGNDKIVNWYSSNTNVASVDKNGKVTAHNAGTATIIATVDGKSDSCEVTVEGTPVTGITLDKSVISVEVGKADTLTATVEPANATNKNVIWKSNNPAIATVENGLVTGVSAGTATIVAITEDSNHIAVCMVTVTAESNVAVYSVSFAMDSGRNIDIKSSRTVKEGDNYTLVLEADEGYVITEYFVTANGTSVADKSSLDPHARTFLIDITNVDGDITIAASAADIFTGQSYFESSGNVVATNYMLIDLMSAASFIVQYENATLSNVDSKLDGKVRVYLCDQDGEAISEEAMIIPNQDGKFMISFGQIETAMKAYMCIEVTFDEIMVGGTHISITKVD